MFLKTYDKEFDDTAQKMKFSIKGFISKCDQICSFLRIWSDLLKKSLMENFIFEQFEIIIAFANQNGRPLGTEDKVNLALLINKQK